MESHRLKSVVQDDYAKNRKKKLWLIPLGILCAIISLIMGLGFLLKGWKTIQPIPNGVITEGVVIHKYYEPASRRLPDRPIIIYSYENPYWAGRAQTPVRSRGGMITAKIGIAARKEVGRSFYKRTEIGDEIVVKYRPSGDIKQSNIKGGLPLGSVIFDLCAALFSLGLTAFFFSSISDIYRGNREHIIE